jgi:hypothetical protein
MAKAKGVQPITTASLAEPKVNVPGIAKPKKSPAMKATNVKAMSALFGKKAMKPTIQGAPTKVPTL